MVICRVGALVRWLYCVSELVWLEDSDRLFSCLMCLFRILNTNQWTQMFPLVVCRQIYTKCLCSWLKLHLTRCLTTRVCFLTGQNIFGAWLHCFTWGRTTQHTGQTLIFDYLLKYSHTILFIYFWLYIFFTSKTIIWSSPASIIIKVLLCGIIHNRFCCYFLSKSKGGQNAETMTVPHSAP